MMLWTINHKFLLPGKTKCHTAYSKRKMHYHTRIACSSSSSNDQPDNMPEDYTPDSFMRAFADSKLIKSEVYLKEQEKLEKENRQIALLLPKFPQMDNAGKWLFIQSLEQFLEGFQTHLARLRLMQDDPAAAKMLNLLNRQLLSAQVDVQTFYTQLKDQTVLFRELAEMEERALSNPTELAKVQDYIKGVLAHAGAVDVREFLEELAKEDPNFINAFAHPDAMRVVGEVTQNPDMAVRFADHPELKIVAQKLADYIRKKRGLL